jgi:Tol biopolymer transport system component
VVSHPGSTTSYDLVLYDAPTNTSAVIATSDSFQFNPQFVTRSRLAYVLTNAGTSRVMVRDLATQQTRSAAVVPSGGYVVALSPDERRLFFLRSDPNGGDSLNMAEGGTAATLTKFAPPVGRDGVLADETRIAFSKDGRYFFVIDTAAGTPTSAGTARLQVRDAGGRLIFGIDQGISGQALSDDSATVRFVAGDPTGGPGFPSAWAPAWSGQDQLYFQEADGIHAWDAATGKATMLLPGLRWYHPSVSDDGQLVAFSALDAGGGPTVQAYDLSARSIVFARTLRWWPTFVMGRTLWYLENTQCPSGGCGPGLSAVPTGRVLAYDLVSKTSVDLPFKGQAGSSGMPSDYAFFVAASPK